MRTIRCGHCLTCKRGAKNEVRFINSLRAGATKSKDAKIRARSACNNLVQQSRVTKSLSGDSLV